jgi:hypothetical protein
LFRSLMVTYNDICSERQTTKKNRLTSQQKKIAFKSNQTSLLHHCKVTLVQLI